MPKQVIPITGVDTVGLIQDTPAVALPPNAFSDALNVRFKDGAIRKMEGEVNIFPGLFNGTADDTAVSYDGTELRYVLWWPNPNLAPLGGYYIMVVRDGDDDVVQITQPTAGSINDQEQLTYNYVRRELYRFTNSTALPGDYQHTFFQGGFAVIINNTKDAPIYIQDVDGNVNDGDDMAINRVPAGQILPGWDSYNVNEARFAGTFDSETQSRIFDLGAEYPFTMWTIRVRVTRGGTVTTTTFNTDNSDEQNGVSVATANGVTSVTFTEMALQDDDMVEINTLSNNPVNVTAGVVRSFGDFLVAGNLVERDVMNDNAVVRNLAGVVRSSDVAPPGSIPNNWNPFAAGVSTADEFVITAEGVVQDMVELQGNLYLYSNRSISVMRSTGNAVIPLTVAPVTNSYGASSTNAVVEFDGSHIVVGSLDIYAFGGHPGSIQSIADARVRRSFYENLSPEHEGRLFLLRYQQRDEIWICYPTVNSTTGNPDRALIWNYRGNTWTQRELTEVLSADFGPIPGGGLPEAGATIGPLENGIDPRDGTPGPEGGGSPGNNGIINIGAREVQTISINPDFTFPSVNVFGTRPRLNQEVLGTIPDIPMQDASTAPSVTFTRQPQNVNNDGIYTDAGDPITTTIPLIEGYTGSDKAVRIAERIADAITRDIANHPAVQVTLDNPTSTLDDIPVGDRIAFESITTPITLSRFDGHATLTFVDEATRDRFISLISDNIPQRLWAIRGSFNADGYDRSFVIEANDFRLLIPESWGSGTESAEEGIVRAVGTTQAIIPYEKVLEDADGFVAGRVSLFEIRDTGVPGTVTPAPTYALAGFISGGTTVRSQFSYGGTANSISFDDNRGGPGTTFATHPIFPHLSAGGYITVDATANTVTVRRPFILTSDSFRAGVPAGVVFETTGNIFEARTLPVRSGTGTILIQNGGRRDTPDHTSFGTNPGGAIINVPLNARPPTIDTSSLRSLEIMSGGNESVARSDGTYSIPVFRTLPSDIIDNLNALFQGNGPWVMYFTNAAFYYTTRPTFTTSGNERGPVEGRIIFTAPEWTVPIREREHPAFELPFSVTRQLLTIYVARATGNPIFGSFPALSAGTGEFTITSDLPTAEEYTISTTAGATVNGADDDISSHFRARSRNLGYDALGAESEIVYPNVRITNASTGNTMVTPIFPNGVNATGRTNAQVMDRIASLIHNDFGTERFYSTDINTGRVYQSGTDTHNVYIDTQGWTDLETEFPPGYRQTTEDNQRLIMTVENATVPNAWNVEIISNGNIGFDIGPLATPLGFESTRSQPAGRVPANDPTNDDRGSILLRATPSYVGWVVSTPAGNRLVITETSSGTNDYNEVTQEGTNGELQSLTSWIDDNIAQLNQFVPEMIATRVGNTIETRPSSYGTNVGFVLEVVANSPEYITRFNELLTIYPEGDTRLGVNPFMNTGSTTLELASIAPNAVVDMNDSQFSPSTTRMPNRNTNALVPTVTYDFEVLPVYSVDRPWLADQVNPNRQYPIFATSVRVNGNPINKITAGDIGYSRPSYLEAAAVTTIDETTSRITPMASTDDFPLAYTSYVEREQFAITPEFDTEDLKSVAVHATGSFIEFINGPNNYNKLLLRLEGTNAPGDVVDLSTEMTNRQSQKQNDFFISEDYKVDMRVHGRFLNMRITDDAFDETNRETVENKLFNKQGEWAISMFQLDIGKGGTR